MHPAFLDNMSWEMAEVYGAITDQILINLAKHFSYFEVDTVPKSVFDYQARMLAQMGQVNKETIRIIKNGLVDADLALQDVLEQAVIDAVKGAEPELLDGVKRGVFQMPTTPIPSANQTRAFKLYYQQAANKLNLVNTVMLESTQAAYQQTVSNVIAEIDLADRMYRTQIALDTAAGETITGVSSWNTALKHATDRLKEGGITGFVDHAGHQWSAEAYVAMDIRTTVFNTGRAAVWETNQDFGNDLYLVSYHNGARPLCYPWQNKVISSTDSARTVVDLDGNEIQVIAQSDTSYGAPAGLFGINCKHYPMPFIPGVSVIDGKPQDKEENDKAYAESQEQRRLERKLREEKRDLQMMKAQGASEEDIAKQREKVRQSSSDIDDFCNSTGRARHRDREAVYTKREFPDADRYDVTQFAQDQKNLVENYYSAGGEQQGFTAGQMAPKQSAVNTPATPSVSETSAIQQAVFTPATTMEEAEEFAKTYCDDKVFGATGVSFKGVSLETANAVNQQLSEFYNTFDVDKFGGVIAPAGNTKLGKRISSATAAFGTVNRSMLLNRQSMKTPALVAKKCAEEKALVTKYIANPASFKVSSTTAKKVLDLSAASGRGTVPDNLFDVINHELGHALQRRLKGVSNYETIAANWKTYGERISGYAAYDFDEYIAESFCSWRKGENLADPEIVSAFMSLMR